MKTKNIIREAVLWIGMFTLSIVLGATIYQMIVIVPEFSKDMPNGMIELAKGHVQTKVFWASPILPIGFLFVILAVVLNWKTPRRKWLMLSASLIILGEVLTDIFLFPNLKIMGLIDGNPSTDTDLLIKNINQWIIADQLRCWLLLVPAFFLFLKALTVKASE